MLQLGGFQSRLPYHQMVFQLYLWLYVYQHNVQDSFFVELNNVYGYPDEHSEAVIRVISKELTVDNYYTKYHNLVYLEEMESSRKIIAE